MPAKHGTVSYACTLCGRVFRPSKLRTAFERAVECEVKDRQQAERELRQERIVKQPYVRNGHTTRATVGELVYLGKLVALRDIYVGLQNDADAAATPVALNMIAGTLELDLDGEKYLVRLEHK